MGASTARSARPARPVYATPEYRRARARILAGSPDCVHGCGRPATEADHQPPLSLHDHAEGTGCCRLVPSCATCARRQGAILSTVGQRLKATPAAASPPRAKPEAPELDGVGWPVDDPIWDVPWLDELRDLPAEATWPRLMTPPHHAAVGTYGPELVEHARTSRGVELRWWQRLTAARRYEHDDDGILVWDDVGVTVARQVGKSVSLREGAMWRIDTGGDRWGEPQLVLHTGKDLSICVEVQRPARRWAKEHTDRYKVRESHGEEQIEVLADGSRWLVRAKENAFGLSATEADVDEAWKVEAELIEEGVVPTMVELVSPQLVLWSTAHRKATGLMVNRRNTILGDLAATDGTLWLEWSASPLLADGDETGWRQASPHWSERRRKLIARRYAAALAGESTEDPDELDPLEAFRTQWLNRWPRRRRRSGRGELLLPEGAWSTCEGTLDQTAPGGVVALEENRGQGAAAAFVAGDGRGRFEVDGRACDSWTDAIALAAQFVKARQGCQILVGARMNNQLPDDFPRRSTASRAGSTETGRGLVLLRNLVSEHRIVHDQTGDLDDQIARARVHPLATGGLGLANNGARSDLLRAALWALDAAQAPTSTLRVH